MVRKLQVSAGSPVGEESVGKLRGDQARARRAAGLAPGARRAHTGRARAGPREAGRLAEQSCDLWSAAEKRKEKAAKNIEEKRRQVEEKRPRASRKKSQAEVTKTEKRGRARPQSSTAKKDRRRLRAQIQSDNSIVFTL